MREVQKVLYLQKRFKRFSIYKRAFKSILSITELHKGFRYKRASECLLNMEMLMKGYQEAQDDILP